MLAHAANRAPVARRPSPAATRSKGPALGGAAVLRVLRSAATEAPAARGDDSSTVWPTPRAGDDAEPLLARLSALGPVAVDAAALVTQEQEEDAAAAPPAVAPIDDLATLLRPSQPNERVAFIALSHFGDLTSFELAQRLARRVLPALNASAPRPPPSLARAVAASSSSSSSAEGSPNQNNRTTTTTTRFVLVGLGSASAARIFARETGLRAAAREPGCPQISLLSTTSASPLYRRALGFEPGFAPDQAQVSPYAKLLVMLAGLGSDRGATIREVLRGYLGDKGADAVFFDRAWTPFDVLGKNYQRPFELATQRLQNMGAVLGKWGDLAPRAEGEEGAMLTQQGGAIVFAANKEEGRGGGGGGGVEVAFGHRDAGILCYVDTDALTASLLE